MESRCMKEDLMIRSRITILKRVMVLCLIQMSRLSTKVSSGRTVDLGMDLVIKMTK